MNNPEEQKVIVGLIENDIDYRSQVVEHLSVNAGIRDIYEWDSAEIFWREGRDKALDILFIDINLPGMDGIELSKNLSIEKPLIKKIILTSLNSDEKIFKALQYGCLGYALKSELEDISNTIQIIKQGGAIISPTIALRVLNSFNKTERLAEQLLLTQRERQILEELASGYTPKKVAENFNLSLNTVRTHIHRIYKKLNVTSTQELLNKAGKMGYLNVE